MITVDGENRAFDEKIEEVFEQRFPYFLADSAVEACYRAELRYTFVPKEDVKTKFVAWLLKKDLKS